MVRAAKAYDSLNYAGERLLDAKMLNVVIVVMLTTAILGPVLTERFARDMPRESTPPNALSPRVPASVSAEPT